MPTLSKCAFIAAATRCTWPRQVNTLKIVPPPPVPWIEFISATPIPAARSRSPASPCASRKSAPNGQTWCSQVSPARKNWRKRPSAPPPTREDHEQGISMRQGTSIARPAGLYRLPDELIFPANFQAIGASITKSLSPGPLDAETRALVGLVASAMPCRDDSVTYHLLRCGEEGWFHDAFAPQQAAENSPPSRRASAWRTDSEGCRKRVPQPV